MKKYISSIYGKINCEGIPGCNLEMQSRATNYFPYDGIWMPWQNVIWTLTRLPIWNESEQPISTNINQNLWVLDITLIGDRPKCLAAISP